MPDTKLCGLVDDAKPGRATDFGGGVFKQRLNDNLHRNILLAKCE